MGRGKLKMEMIGDEKTRYRTFGNRSKGLKKKLHELSTLCDVEACLILYHGDAADGPVLLGLMFSLKTGTKLKGL